MFKAAQGPKSLADAIFGLLDEEGVSLELGPAFDRARGATAQPVQVTFVPKGFQ